MNLSRYKLSDMMIKEIMSLYFDKWTGKFVLDQPVLII